MLQVPIAGCAFIRIPTDVEPFSDVRVRQALNMRSMCSRSSRRSWRATASACRISSYRMDLDTTRNSRPILTTGESARAAGRGWVSGWVRHLLDVTVTERVDVIEAIAGQLTVAGIRTEVNRLELALFNSGDYWLEPTPLLHRCGL